MMERLLLQAEARTAQNVIKANYRKGAFIGDGSTADIREFEKATGLRCGRKPGTTDHAQKVKDNIKHIERTLAESELSENDRALLRKILRKLKKVE